jgi:hypothetical protein
MTPALKPGPSRGPRGWRATAPKAKASAKQIPSVAIIATDRRHNLDLEAAGCA